MSSNSRVMYKYLVICALLAGGVCLPQGAPESVCVTMLPFHGGGIPAQTDQPPYGIVPNVGRSAEGARLRVTLGSPLGLHIKGFMLQARDALDGRPVGEFVGTPEGQAKGLDCGSPNDTVTHTGTEKKSALDFDWRPPDSFVGRVIFKATVAQEYGTFWVGFDSAPVSIVKRSELGDDGEQLGATPERARPTTTTPHYAPERTEQVAVAEDAFYNGCFVEKGCFGSPVGCVRTRSCKAAVATVVRGDRYEFELKAPRDAAYVAVGLSEDAQMGDDSVIECVREGNGAKAYMSRTIPRPNLGVEKLPKPTVGIEMISYNITDGVLYCKVRRDVKTVVAGREFDIVNQKYFLLVAAGKELYGKDVGFHDVTYLAAGESRYLTDVTELAAASKLLLRLHGAFMLVAWVGTASVGILLARYFRQTWVGSQLCGKDQWFAWHRTFMACTWSLTVAGFVVIFVELRAWSTERNPHAVLGLVTTVICFLQPIGAFFRPHPGTSRRPLFNWIHWLGGNVAHILAIVTIFFAVKLNKAELPEWMDWILVAFVAFHVCMHLIYSILGCVSDRTAERRVTSFPMKDLGGAGRIAPHVDRNMDAPNSSVRKTLLAIYLFVIILLVAAMVVVVVLAPFEETWSNLKKNVM